MPRKYMIGADERAVLLACCWGWLECALFSAETTGVLVLGGEGRTIHPKPIRRTMRLHRSAAIERRLLWL